MIGVEVGGLSRRRLLAAGGGGLAGLALAACGGEEPAVPPTAGTIEREFGPGDLGIVRFALTLELVSIAFYEQALATGALVGSAATLYRRIAADEAEHAEALEGLAAGLGGSVTPEETDFGLTDLSTVLASGAALEDLIAAGYLGQIPNCSDGEVRAELLSIAAVEAAHAVATGSLIGAPPTPSGAFARPADLPDVLPAIDNLTAG